MKTTEGGTGMESVRTMVFVADQRGNCEDLYRCRETGRVYIRQECDEDHVRWFTSNKWSGGYEASCPMREGLELHITDKAGNLLFTESICKEPGYDWTVAKKEAPFSWDAIRAISEEVLAAENLKTHDEWIEWIDADREASGFRGYRDNWLYGEAAYEKPQKIGNRSLLGQKVLITRQEGRHKISGKTWACYEIRRVDMVAVLDICGFQF